jgi:hypothetical protein
MFDRTCTVKIEICTDPEWLVGGQAVGTFLSEKDLANIFFDAANRSLEKSGLFGNAEIIGAQGQRIFCHGWNGASWFGGSNVGSIATFFRLSERREAAMQTAAVAGDKAVQDAVKESPLPNN